MMKTDECVPEAVEVEDKVQYHKLVQDMAKRYSEQQRIIALQQNQIEKYAADNSKQYDAINDRISENIRIREEQHQQEIDEAKKQANRIIQYHKKSREHYIKTHRLDWIAMLIALVDVVVAMAALLYVARSYGLISIIVVSFITIVTDVACGLGIVRLVRLLRGR